MYEPRLQWAPKGRLLYPNEGRSYKLIRHGATKVEYKESKQAETAGEIQSHATAQVWRFQKAWSRFSCSPSQRGLEEIDRPAVL